MSVNHFRKGVVRVKNLFFIMVFGLMLCQCGGKTAAVDEPDRVFSEIEDGVFDENGNRVEGGKKETEEGGTVKYPETLEADTDGDGLLDAEDVCPDDPEDLDNFEDSDGCPEPDNDQDKIPDGDDDCPNEPETYNGTEDEDGCPDKSMVVVISCPGHGPIPTLVYYNKKKLKIRKQDYAILDAVVEVIKANPQILRVQVAAHSDGKGKKKKNIKITKKMAAKVIDYIAGKGVDKKIFSAAGYGGECPISKKAKDNNRIAFILLETDHGCASDSLQCAQSAPIELVPEEDRKYLPGSDYCE